MPALTVDGLIAEIEERDAQEAAGSAAGVNLLTYHRAKGLEWDAVLLPALEEGLLPVRQAKHEDAVAEERRLLYVGITRARRHLALSWAERRVGANGKEGRRERSRFLAALEDGPTGRRPAVRPRTASTAPTVEGADEGLLEALRGWRRERARSDSVPAYVDRSR